MSYSGLVPAIKKEGFKQSDYRHSFWQDEIQDPFILTRNLEIFLFNDETIGVYIYLNKAGTLRKVRKAISNPLDIWHEINCDENIYEFRTYMRYLPEVFAAGNPLKNRAHVKGKWLKCVQELLGHEIHKFNPHDPDREKADTPLYLLPYLYKKKVI